MSLDPMGSFRERLESALRGEDGPRHPTLDAIRSLVSEKEQAIKARASALTRLHEADRALLEATEALEGAGVEPPPGCDPEGPPSPVEITQWVQRACEELQDERGRNERLAASNRQMRSDLAGVHASNRRLSADLERADAALVREREEVMREPWVKLLAEKWGVFAVAVNSDERLAALKERLPLGCHIADGLVEHLPGIVEEWQGAIAACGRWELAAQGRDPGPDADDVQRLLFRAVTKAEKEFDLSAGSLLRSARGRASDLCVSKEG